MNPLLNNNNGTSPLDMMRKFNEFKQSISGQDPQQLLDQIIKSGKFSQDQINQAVQMAQQFKGILK